jgi:hypothetical protein
MRRSRFEQAVGHVLIRPPLAVAFLFLFTGKPHKQPAMSQYRLKFAVQIGRIIGPAFRPL